MNMINQEMDYKTKSIDYDDFIDCPEDYQRFVKRLMSIHAYSEVSGARDIGIHLGTAPNYKLREAVAKIVYQETMHARMIFKILEKINVGEEQATAIATGKVEGYRKTQSLESILAAAHEENEWIDMLLNHMLNERAGSYMIFNYTQSSFKPWAEVSEKIYEDEKWHINFGLTQFESYIQEHDIANVAAVFNKWYIHSLNFFGPPSHKYDLILKHYGLKRRSNEELRQEYKKEIKDILSRLGVITLISDKISQQYPYTLI